MAVGAINQNNILDIIKSDIKDTINMINDILSYSLSEIDFDKAKNNIEKTNNLIYLILGDNGLLSILIKNIKNISVFDFIKIPLMLKSLKYYIDEILSIINSINNEMNNQQFDTMSNMENLMKYVESLNQMINSFNLFSILLVKYINVFSTLKYISSIKFDESSIKNLDDLNLITTGIVDFMNQFNEIKGNSILKIITVNTLLKNALLKYLEIIYTAQYIKLDDSIIKNLDDLNLTTIGIVDFINQFKNIDNKSVLEFAVMSILLKNILINYLETVYTIQNNKIDESTIKNIDDLNTITDKVIEFLNKFNNIDNKSVLEFAVVSILLKNILINYLGAIYTIQNNKIDESTIKNIDDLNTITDKVIEFLNKFNNIDNKSVLEFTAMSILLKNILINYLGTIYTIQNNKIDESTIKNIDDLNTITDKVIEFLNKFNNIDNKSVLEFAAMSILLKNILINYLGTVYTIQNNKIDESTIKNIDDLNTIIAGVVKFISEFNNVDNKTLMMFILTEEVLKQNIIKYFELINLFENQKISKNIINELELLNSINEKIINFISQFNKINKSAIQQITLFSRLINKKLLLHIFETINDIILYLTEVKNFDIKTIKEKLNTFEIVISTLKNILINLIILIPLFILVTAALPIIIIGLLVIKAIVFFIVYLMSYNLNERAEKNMILLTIITSLLIIVSLNILAISAISILILHMWKPLILFFAILPIILISIILISNLAASPKNILNIIIMGLFISAIIVIASEILILAAISNTIIPLASNIFLFFLVLTGVIVSITLLGIGLIWALPFISAAALALIPLTVAIATIVLIASMLNTLKQINFSEADKTNISNNIRNVIDTALLVIASIFYGSDVDINGRSKNNEVNKLRNDNWFIKIIKGISEGSGLVLMALAAAAILTPLIIATFSILLIAGMLWLLGKINFTPKDKENIKDNVSLVIQTALDVISNIFDRNSADTTNKPENRGWFSNLINYTLSGLSNIIGAIMSVGFLALSIVSISMILLLAGELKLLSKINLDITTIQTNIKNVIDCALSVIDAIFNSNSETKKEDSNKGFLGKTLDWLSDKVGGFFNGIKNISGMLASMGFLSLSLISVGMVYVLAQQLTYISEIKFNSSIITGKLNNIIKTSNTIIDVMAGSEITGDYISKIKSIQNNSDKFISIINIIKKLTDSISDLNDLSDKDAQNNTKVVDNYIRFIDKINTLKLENVRSMTNMFKQMSDFSRSINGNFDNLADALIEKIAPLLQELRDIMSKLPNDFNASIKTSSENISKTIVNTSGSPASWTKENINKAVQITDNEEEQERIKKEQMLKAKEAKEEQERISTILKDITDILTGSGAYPQGVKTC